ncbi:conserved Plasmodium protein, unknown function [Plasmodium vinckei]|uniref:Intron-binding protein aquarius n=1 Tax=Plasmodium vinckei TaxID=5860 RepID=A0A6V7SJ71_PLAVN|nr:conserved Plasmodium protein, unknown function [Plasmodium vinckei]
MSKKLENKKSGKRSWINIFGKKGNDIDEFEDTNVSKGEKQNDDDDDQNYDETGFVINHIDFNLFCMKNKETSDDINKNSNCDSDLNEENVERIDEKTLSFIGKTYDMLKARKFNFNDLKKVENSQYFEKIIWSKYNMYDNLYTLSNNNVFFLNDNVEDNKLHLLYIKHILSLIVLICYKYEEKGKHEIWDQIIYNKIDEFEKLVEVEKNGHLGEDANEINERFNLYKLFLIQKFNNLFYNVLKLINYNFVFNEYNGKANKNDTKGNSDKTNDADHKDNFYKEIKDYRKRLFKLDFLEKSFIIQFFINIYSSIDKKFLFKLCLDLCNPFIWKRINYDYLNFFLFKKNKDAKSLFDNISKMMEKKYLNNKKYGEINVYTSNCKITFENDNHDAKINEYDENIILFINKNEFFYNLINYFLIILDIIEGKFTEFDELSSNSSISSCSDNDIDDLELEEYEHNMKLLNSEQSHNINNLEKSNIPDKEGDSGYALLEEKIDSSDEDQDDSLMNNNEEGVENDDSIEFYLMHGFSDDERNNKFSDINEYKKEEILEMFLKYENKLKNKKYATKNMRKKGKTNHKQRNKYIILFVEKCIEFFIDLLSQLYSRRILYILMKYFNIFIYCKISILNKNKKFKELIRLFKYYIEMYINNFSGDSLTYLEINNEHYKNFEYFQVFCYKHFQKHEVLQKYYLKSVFLMDKKKELLTSFSKLKSEELLFLCKNLKYIVTPEEENDRENSTTGISNSNNNNYVFEHMRIFNKKNKLFYITLLMENLCFKNNIFEDIDKQCEYPNEKDLFENILIDTKDDLKDKKRKRKKTFLYTKPLFKLNLQYLCINDYIFRIYNLFKLQSYHDIRKDIIDYVYETNPKNKKVNDNTICKYVFEIDENNINNEYDAGRGEDDPKFLNFDTKVNSGYQNGSNSIINFEKKRKTYDNEDLEEYKMIDNNGNSSYSYKLYNEYQLNSIVYDVNKLDNTYFANERRMSNKIDSFKIVNVDITTKKVTAEILIDLKYKQYEKIYNEWNMIRPSDILFLVSVKNYTNYYKNKINMIDDNDLKNLLGINYLRGCEVIQYGNAFENDEGDENYKKCTLKKITVYLDYTQYQRDIVVNPDIYNSFNLLIRRKQKENNFYYILNNIKTLIMNPDDAVIPSWVHDIFLGYCKNSIKYYQDYLPKKENTEIVGNLYSDDSDDESDTTTKNNKENMDKNVKGSKKKLAYNKENLNFIKKNIDDINYLNTFLSIKHALSTTNGAYVCIDLSHINISSEDNKINIKNIINEYIEPLFLSYVPIKYENEKKSLQKNSLQKSILESLYYHICIINKYKIDDMNFVSKFTSNIKGVYYYDNEFFFNFEFNEKEYILILNNYIDKALRKEEAEKILKKIKIRAEADEEDCGILINDSKGIKEIFEHILNDSIKHLSTKDDIYRIQNNIYEDPNYPLEGLLIHSQKKNSTNVEIAKKENNENDTKNKINYTKRQIECIKSGLYEGITIIEGVPGSGKTSILNKIINILFNNKKQEKILICTHSNSCLNYIFNLLVKENLIHQKYLCRVGMGEVDIENLRNEYEELEKMLSKNGDNNFGASLDSVNKLNNVSLHDEDDNFNFSKYGRINYMIDLREKLLNDANLLSESTNNNKIYNCLSANQYYENVVKKRVSKFLKYVNMFKKNEVEDMDNIFNSYITSCIDDQDIYNLFLCPKIYVKNTDAVENIIWKSENANAYNYKGIENQKILDEDKACFYFIHPKDQINTLNLSIYNVLFPFKKYINLKLYKVDIDLYLNYISIFASKNIKDNEKKEITEDYSESVESSNNQKSDKAMGEEENDNCDIKEGIKEKNYDIFKGDIANDMIFGTDDDFYVSKYYISKIVMIFEHLHDCRPFEILKSQKERGIYIITKLARVIAMTCTHASINRSKIAKLQFYFDNIIIDECTQITENDTFLPLLLQENRYHKSKLKRIIFVGDSNQLPPIIKNKYIKNYANYEQSLYKRFLRLDLPSIYLNEQGRMRNEICNVYKYFYSKYNIQIENLDCINKDKFLKDFNPGFTYTYQFIHVKSEEYTPVPYFYQNLLEAEMAVAIFMYMRLIGYPNEMITILTTYNGQKELILDILKKNCLYNKLIGIPKKVTTVDKYQGKQNDFVIISLVRSKSIGYMKNVKRLIVAFSRARYGLYVVGNYNLYKKNYEFKKPLYFFKKNKLDLSLQMNENFNSIERQSNNPPVIIKDLNQFYSVLYSLSNAQLSNDSSITDKK